MHGADCGNTMRARDESADHIAPISMTVHDAGSQLRNECADQAKFAEIIPGPNYDRRDRNTKFPQLNYERVIDCHPWLDYGRDMYRRLLSTAHHRHYTLESALKSWRENVQNFRIAAHYIAG